MVEGTETVTLLVCRGCCCGTDEKHPDVDHGAQLHILRSAVDRVPGARLRVTDCLGPCERSNVIAVRHRDVTRPGVRIGTTWLGGVLETKDTDRLAAWVVDRASPGSLPETLASFQFDVAEISVTPDHEITFLDNDAPEVVLAE